MVFFWGVESGVGHLAVPLVLCLVVLKGFVWWQGSDWGKLPAAALSPAPTHLLDGLVLRAFQHSEV